MTDDDAPRGRPGARRGRAPHGPAEPPTPTPGPVTALRESPRRAGRYTVEVGGVPVAPVSVETIGELKLGMGRAVDAPTLARLLEASAHTACYDKALDALARRARSTRELERWLAQRGQPATAIAAAVEKLTALGLLDDAAFARGFARSRLQGKGFGPRRVAAELSKKGVARATADAVIAELDAVDPALDPDGDPDLAGGEGGRSRSERELARVRAAAGKRLRSLASLEPEVARRRLTGWLVRRGYAPGAAARVARELIPR